MIRCFERQDKKGYLVQIVGCPYLISVDNDFAVQWVQTNRPKILYRERKDVITKDILKGALSFFFNEHDPNAPSVYYSDIHGFVFKHNKKVYRYLVNKRRFTLKNSGMPKGARKTSVILHEFKALEKALLKRLG